MLLSAIDFQLSDRVASFSWHDVTSLFSALYNRIVGLCGKIRHKLNNREYNTPSNQKGVLNGEYVKEVLSLQFGDTVSGTNMSDVQKGYFCDWISRPMVWSIVCTWVIYNVVCPISWDMGISVFGYCGGVQELRANG